MKPAAVVLTILGLAAAEAGEATGVLSGVQRWLDATRDLQGRFEQTLISGAMGTGVTESGEVYIQRPGRMRWDYLDPERKVALIDGVRTELYIEEDAELLRGRLDEESDLLTTLLTGDRRLAELFEASLLADARPGAYRLSLAPRQREESFERIVLTVRPPEFAIEAAEVLDPAGNRMLYLFYDLRRNRRLPDGVFRFQPPPGTMVSGEP